MTGIADWQRETADVLAGMLTENTGRHFLDSGDAYGRNWERNAGKDADAFFAEPQTTVSAWNGRFEYFTLSVFHYLLDRLEYDKELDAEFHEFAKDSDAPWLVDMENWLSSKEIVWNTYNSYNGEESLSQVIQWCGWRDEEWGDDYILLQIHGGADVRGGYSSGHVFKVTVDYFASDIASGELYCTNPECGWGVSIMNGDVIDREGSLVEDNWEGEAFPEDSDVDMRVAHCPQCDAPIEAGMPYAG